MGGRPMSCASAFNRSHATEIISRADRGETGFRVSGLSGRCYNFCVEFQTDTTEDTAKMIDDVIWIDPERVSGAPCFINTRVPIQNLFAYLEAGHPLEDFLEGFPPVTREQAEKVLELARDSLFQSILNGENSSRP